jgi:putative FmdB family regulatory protein
VPRYVYFCVKCDIEFNVDMSINDASVPPCTSCGDTAVKRLPSSPNFSVRGFSYANHYGLKGDKK